MLVVLIPTGIILVIFIVIAADVGIATVATSLGRWTTLTKIGRRGEYSRNSVGIP